MHLDQLTRRRTFLRGEETGAAWGESVVLSTRCARKPTTVRVRREPIGCWSASRSQPLLQGSDQATWLRETRRSPSAGPPCAEFAAEKPSPSRVPRVAAVSSAKRRFGTFPAGESDWFWRIGARSGPSW